MTSNVSLDVLENLITSTIGPAAPDVDDRGEFPRTSIDALLANGFGGLISAPEVGGAGGTFADAAAVGGTHDDAVAAVDAFIANHGWPAEVVDLMGNAHDPEMIALAGETVGAVFG